MTDSIPGGIPGASAEDAAPPLTESKYCSGCGVLIHKSAVQCPRCGAPQAVPQAVSTAKHSRIAAILFAILLGWMGVHKFYLGQIGWGVVYALFFWTCIPAIAGLIEGILYLTMTDEEFAAKYG